jgi:hypothetical protein
MAWSVNVGSTTATLVCLATGLQYEIPAEKVAVAQNVLETKVLLEVLGNGCRCGQRGRLGCGVKFTLQQLGRARAETLRSADGGIAIVAAVLKEANVAQSAERNHLNSKFEGERVSHFFQESLWHVSSKAADCTGKDARHMCG